MDKAKIFTKQSDCISDSLLPHLGKGINICNPEKELLNEDLIAKALWECLCDGDTAEFMDILETHLLLKNKSKFCRESGLSRTTLYNTFKDKNPTLTTLSKLVQSLNK